MDNYMVGLYTFYSCWLIKDFIHNTCFHLFHGFQYGAVNQEAMDQIIYIISHTCRHNQSLYQQIYTQPIERALFFKIFEKTQPIHCTGLLRSIKLVHLDSKNLTCFIQNLVYNLMNLVPHSKCDRKCLKKG